MKQTDESQKPAFHPQIGLTLRDYFAAAALPSLVTPALNLDHKKWAATAQHAYIIADEMMKERDGK